MWVPIQLENIQAAYCVVEERVQRALRVQLGDQTRLADQRQQVLLLLQSAEQVRRLTLSCDVDGIHTLF